MLAVICAGAIYCCAEVALLQARVASELHGEVKHYKAVHNAVGAANVYSRKLALFNATPPRKVAYGLQPGDNRRLYTKAVLIIPHGHANTERLFACWLNPYGTPTRYAVLCIRFIHGATAAIT